MRWEGLAVDCTDLSLRRGHRQARLLLLLYPVWCPPSSAWPPGWGTLLALTHSWCSWLSSSWYVSSCGPVWGPIWTTGWLGLSLENPRKSKPRGTVETQPWTFCAGALSSFCGWAGGSGTSTCH